MTAAKKRMLGSSNPFAPDKYPNCFRGHEYAEKVISGEIPNCTFIIGACRRYMRDLDAGVYPFDAEGAERFLRIVQQFEHVKGNWATKNIKYEPWQCFGWMNIIGFRNPDTGFRRFRTVHWEIPRGNAKSSMASMAVLYYLALDNPVGNEISTVATTRDQARIVLDSARAMAQKSKSYLASTGTKVLAHQIIHPKSHSKVRALSSDATSLDGLNDILAVMDELHAMKADTFDVVSSGMKKRKDSLMLCITTAGFDVDSVGFSQSAYAKKVAMGEVEDDSFFALIYTIDKADDIFSEVTWRKANPGYGVSVDPVAFAATAKKAQETPRDLPNFKTKHLDLWLSEAQAFYDQAKWDLCADPTLKLEDFKGQKCMVGIDIASKIDLTSVATVFQKDGTYYIFDHSYIPEDTVKEVRSALYENCIASGHLIATKGEAIQYPQIKKDVVDQSKMFKIEKCFFDKWNAIELSQQLTAERIEMVSFGMTTSNLSEPTKQLDALMRQGRIRHNGSPLLRWCLGNVVAKEDAASNVFPKKNHEKLKIDPIIAIIMALAGWLQEPQTKSVYATRGIRSL